jgi:hypothetical protein
MAKLYLAALLAAAAVSVQAQPAPEAVPIESVDSAHTRKVFRDLSVCLAKARPRWARETLSHPYLSEAQSRAASEALGGRDNCVPGTEGEFTFRPAGMVGNLAEHFVRTDIERADFARLKTVLSTLAPLNVSEDFALCLAARDPAAARDLALSDLGSPAEMAAANRIATHVNACTNEGEKLKIDLQGLRALVSVALYRGLSTVQARS